MSVIKNNIKVVFSSHLGVELDNWFIEHIHSTIGVEHEVVRYENFNQYSLSELYNKAFNEHISDDSIMVFCHPDIVYKTDNWGKTLLNHFNNSNYGIIGLAGTTYLTETGRWWEKPETMYGIVEHTDGEKVWVSNFSKPINGIQPVVAIDGVFIAVDPTKLINKFDENYGKFHFYDLTFSFPNFLDGVNVGVITSIRILHKSVGKVNDVWEFFRRKFAEDYKNTLPMSLPPVYGEIKSKLTTEPKVTIIIPTKNNLTLLSDNIVSWKRTVKYKNYDIIIADTGSDPETLKGYDYLIEMMGNLKVVNYDYYNFAKINNDVVKNHVSTDTEVILFCNDDILLLNDVLTKCIYIYNTTKNVGTIGIRLHFGDGTIQHCGVKLFSDKNKNLQLTHKDFRKISNYSKDVNYDSFGNTAAFLLINKNLFNELGGFNEEYTDCFEDVELNVKCILKRKKNVTACDAVAYHYESVSRKRNEIKEVNTKQDFEKIIHLCNENKGVLKKYL